MKIMHYKFLCLFIALILGYPARSQDLCTVVGWATQNGGTTGGGNATPVIVNNYNDFKSAVTSSSVKVVYVQGMINFPANGRVTIQDLSDKTIFGLPGSRLISTDISSDGSGIFYIKRCTNLILRNLYFEGPGAYDVDGNDNLTVDNCQNVWVDHCEFHDGLDGNFDIKNGADFISATWCTFSYEKDPIGGGSGGSNDHRYSNLIGSSDGATGDAGKLNVTFQYCWWGEGCRERMPRVRYGKLHIVNNLFTSSVSNNCIRAGYKANILAEGNYFQDQAEPIDLYNGDYTAVKGTNNFGASDVNEGTVFTPPYSITVADPADIVTPIKTCAGATLPSNSSCSTCGVTDNPGNKTPIVSITSPTNNQQFTTVPASISVAANASDDDGSVTKVDFYAGATFIGTDNSSPYTFTWSDVAEGNYTITAKATDDKGAETTSGGIQIIVGDNPGTGQPASLTKHGSGSSTQTVNVGQSITAYYYEWTNATNVAVSGMPAGISVVIDTDASRVDISGSPTEAGTFDFTVTTIGGTPEASKTGSITVTGTLVTGMDAKDAHLIHIYPNPVHYTLNLSKEAKWQLTNSLGQVIGQGFGNAVEMNAYPKGLYFIKIEDSLTKIIKE